MEIIIASWLGSIFISVFIGNVVGIHYLKKLDIDWEKTLNKFIDEINR